MATNNESSVLLLFHFLKLSDDFHERSPPLDETAQGHALLGHPIHDVTPVGKR
jgi:hypothetical protein